jgi:hypothetical protein
MKTAILVALILSLVTSAMPVAAHDLVSSEQGPIGRSIATEAARLAAVQMKATSRAMPTMQRGRACRRSREGPQSMFSTVLERSHAVVSRKPTTCP